MNDTAEKLKRILKDRRGLSFPLVIAITLVLVILLTGLSEYFRLHIIASGVREAVQDAIISTVNDNYGGVYHGAREGYSGGYQTDGSSSWEQAVTEGDIYSYLDSVLGTEEHGGAHTKYAGDTGTAVEFSITGFRSASETRRWPPPIPGTPSGSKLTRWYGWRYPSGSAESSCPPCTSPSRCRRAISRFSEKIRKNAGLPRKDTVSCDVHKEISTRTKGGLTL